MTTFEDRTGQWLLACFGGELARDAAQRNHRFLEEALELVQALGCTRSDAHQLVDYVFDRPVGEVHQELGGVMLTLAAVCWCQRMSFTEAAEAELERVWANIDRIRQKQAAKPAGSPLPGAV